MGMGLSTGVGVSASTGVGQISNVASLTTNTSTTAAAQTGPVMTYRQLEDFINKSTLDLEEQEKQLLNQATQVNAWDRQLVSNGNNITQLNGSVEHVKLDQERLDTELNFVATQQRELDELLTPLERAVEAAGGGTQQHADMEREHTYRLAEGIDAQLKRMAEDLREMIEHVNAANKVQDANDPMVQISKILNAHMDSLQWLDENTSLLQRKVDEVSRQLEHRRTEQERALRVGFD